MNDEDLELLARQTRAMYETTSGSTARIVNRDKEPATFVPAFVAFDKMVLRFGAYFKESVVESKEENYRVRRCEIVYFLEDDSIAVNEKAQENSGIPQGQFVRRHCIPSATRPGDFIGLHDLAIGRDVTIYGRTFHIADADEFTRNYYDEKGHTLKPNEPFPEDHYIEARKRAVNAKGAPTREPKPAMDAYAQFLKFDGEMLHFFALWDDTDALYGEKRKFMLKYYLADDTVEVNEIYKPNCGFDPYPKFFRRGKLFKTSRLPQPGEKPDFIKESELRIGAKVPIAGRMFFIYDCTDKTREYYKRKYNVVMDPIESGEEPAPEPVDPPLPPPTGFGSEEDSLGSVYSLMPKPPRKDLVKLMNNEGKTLRFLARMDTQRPDDLARRFIISYFLMDDTVQIFEPQQRNSGIVSGKFLERRRVNRPDGLPFTPEDFYVGAVVEMLAQKFILIDVDDHSLSFMEKSGYPMSNIDIVRQRILEEIARSGGDPATVFRRADVNGDGHLSIPEFRSALRSLAVDLTEQEVLTVMRHYDLNKDGKVQYSEFLRGLDSMDYAPGNEAARIDRSSRPTPQEALALAKVMDTFREKVHNRRPTIRDTFRELDTNKDSLLSVEEFKAGLDKIGITLNPRMHEFLLEVFFFDEEENLWKPSIDYSEFIERFWSSGTGDSLLKKN